MNRRKWLIVLAALAVPGGWVPFLLGPSKLFWIAASLELFLLAACLGLVISEDRRHD
jgi:hypothetical protein